MSTEYATLEHFSHKSLSMMESDVMVHTYNPSYVGGEANTILGCMGESVRLSLKNKLKQKGLGCGSRGSVSLNHSPAPQNIHIFWAA
jgi:hypothetical protein